MVSESWTLLIYCMLVGAISKLMCNYRYEVLYPCSMDDILLALDCIAIMEVAIILLRNGKCREKNSLLSCNYWLIVYVYVNSTVVYTCMSV